MLAGSVVGVSGWGNIDVGSDGRTLQVVRAGTHNPDDYTCTATNQAGVIDIPVTLNDLGKVLHHLSGCGTVAHRLWCQQLDKCPTVHDVTHSENRTSLENRYEDINSFDNYNKVYDYTYEYPVSALTPPDREGEQRRNNTGWYSISKDRTRLTLPRVSRTEEGLYSCEITKQDGSTRRIFRVDALAQ
ncbi:hypothetical protein Pcinc_005371 [Petrolisthes cinctipes]|uniref:Ig-like domain-containing protein n=1 Tax=Petrolisthes cinctipes TaxID=88211 RepID=A0AAE1L074_PETCI|nr:hypothetical protein Pcinc_005371 [Petrolisthes cinctipes]